ncbi:hypothetical protein HK105_205568 [Polyrhizophydium stewartii]|uniref:Ankyrin repeat protein n=1 Tax=Polyrhizophydium stewartii TaxID=2732419 RepID=A0ABR4N5M5_9FUNG
MLLWLPTELRLAILLLAGPLTRLLQGDLQQPLSEPMLRAVLADCFRLDLVHLAHALVPRGAELTGEALLIRSEAMERAVAEVALQSVYVRPVPSLLDMRVRGVDQAALSELEDLVHEVERETEPLANELLDVVLALARQRDGPPPSPHADVVLLECAAGLGRADVVRALIARPLRPSWATFDLAARRGHTHIVRMLLDAGLADRVSLDGALAGDRVDALDLLLAHAPHAEPDEFAVQAALAGGRLQCIWRLLRRDPAAAARCDAFAGLRDWCAAFGHDDMLRFAETHGIGVPATAEAMDCAAQAGNLAQVRRLHGDRGTTCTTRAMNGAALRGHLDVLRFLHAHRTEGCTGVGFKWAASAGHFECFRWLWETLPHQRPADGDAIAAAARNGHLRIVEFVVEQQRWAGMAAVLEHAVAGGHCALAQMLVDRGLACATPRLMDVAARSGHVCSAEWVHTQLAPQRALSMQPGDEYAEQCLESACQAGHVGMIAFLVETCGVAVTVRACTAAAAHGRLAAVQYLFEAAPRVGWQAVRERVRGVAGVRIARWLDARLAEPR